MSWFLLIYLFIGYFVVWFIPKISGLRIGFFSKVFTPPATLPIILVIYNDFSWIIDVGLILLQIFLAISVLLFFSYENKNDQEFKDEKAKEILKSIENRDNFEPFALYLRPFDTTNKLMTQQVQTAHGPSMHIDFETLLERALELYFFLCGLGKSGEMIGAGRIETEDDKWYKSFQLLAEKASLIVMIPSNHESTFQEMKHIAKNKLLYKCIFLMPETVDVNLDYDFVWMDTQLEALKLGWDLPDYNSCGGIFNLNNDGTCDIIENLSMSSKLFRVQRLRKIIERFDW
jgi:hypothetical protein